MGKTIDERIEDERAKHEVKLNELESERRLAEQLPLQPQFIHFADGKEPWIKYEVESIPQAIEILHTYAQAFGPVPGEAREDGCVYVGPLGKHEKGKVRWASEAGLVEVSIGRGRGFSTNSVRFWILLNDGRHAKVCLDWAFRASWPWRYSPQCDVRYDSHGNVTSARHELPALGEWRRIKWGSGTPEACHWSLYFDCRETARDWLQSGIEEKKNGG